MCHEGEDKDAAYTPRLGGDCFAGHGNRLGLVPVGSQTGPLINWGQYHARYRGEGKDIAYGPRLRGDRFVGFMRKESVPLAAVK